MVSRQSLALGRLGRGRAHGENIGAGGSAHANRARKEKTRSENQSMIQEFIPWRREISPRTNVILAEQQSRHACLRVCRESRVLRAGAALLSSAVTHHHPSTASSVPVSLSLVYVLWHASPSRDPQLSECSMAPCVCVWSFNNFNPYEASLPGRRPSTYVPLVPYNVTVK